MGGGLLLAGVIMIIKFINQLEETVLAVLLAAMTLVTFTQVIARYVFNTGATWALEFTIFFLPGWFCWGCLTVSGSARILESSCW